jgi:hypothetical protein
VKEASALERIRDALADAAGDGDPVALGWATVELDRAAAEFSGVLGLAPGAFAPADDSVALGARCRVAGAVLPGRISLAILEPSTEGRLAETLARLGEGPAAVWSTTDRLADPGAVTARPGPFGPERLVSGGPRYGPHRFLISTAPGTIAR